MRLMQTGSFDAATLNRALDIQGNTLLHLAAIHKDTQAIATLLDAGADPKVKNTLSLNFYDLAHYLLDKGSSSMKIGIYSQKEQLIKFIDEKQFEAFFQVRYLDHLQFDRYAILHWSLKRNQKKIRKREIQKNNLWTRALLEKELYKKKMPPIYIKWVNSFIGYGIFAAEDIAEYTFVGEYTGLVKRRRKRRNLDNDYVFGYVSGPIDTPYVIDAKYQGNFVRFINHSYEPNLTSRWVISDGISHIVLFANRFIPKDCQLTYDYGPYYWKSRSAPINL